MAQTTDKKHFSPFRGRSALSANGRTTEILDFAILVKLPYVNRLNHRLCIDCFAQSQYFSRLFSELNAANRQLTVTTSSSPAQRIPIHSSFVSPNTIG